MKILYLSTFLLIASCSSGTKTDAPIETKSVASDPTSTPQASATTDPVKPVLKNFTEADVAKFTMAVVMGHSPKIISVKKEGSLYIVSYDIPRKTPVL